MGEIMSDSESTSANPEIFAGWYDEKGCGPDVVTIALEPIPPPGSAFAFPRSLMLAINADDDSPASHAYAHIVGGGLSLSEDGVRELHRRLGAWLGGS
jgi:hypothetical protein